MIAALVALVPISLAIGFLLGRKMATDQNRMAMDLIQVLKLEGSFRESLDSLTRSIDKASDAQRALVTQGDMHSKTLDSLDKGFGNLVKLLLKDGRLSTTPRHEQVGPGMNEEGDGLKIPPRRFPEAAAGGKQM